MAGKLVLFAVYIATMFLLFYLIDQVNYLANLTMINLASAIIPPTVVYVGYLQIKETDSQNSVKVTALIATKAFMNATCG